MICIYVAIGQKESTVRTQVETLQPVRCLGLHNRCDSLCFTTISIALPSSCVGSCYGRRIYVPSRQVCLIVWSRSSSGRYRSFPLVCRPPGRSFPGDVFTTVACLSDQLKPMSLVVDLLQPYHWPRHKREIFPPYIATNVISITDGQIFLGDGLFNGIRPAMMRVICIPCRWFGTDSEESCRYTRIDLAHTVSWSLH